MHGSRGAWFFYVIAPGVVAGIVASIWCIMVGAIGLLKLRMRGLKSGPPTPLKDDGLYSTKIFPSSMTNQANERLSSIPVK